MLCSKCTTSYNTDWKGGRRMIKLDYRSRTPIYRQLEDSIIEMILLGVYQKGTQLPSVRSLAVELASIPIPIQKLTRSWKARGSSVQSPVKAVLFRGWMKRSCSCGARHWKRLLPRCGMPGWQEYPVRRSNIWWSRSINRRQKGGRNNDRDRKAGEAFWRLYGFGRT